MRIDFPYPDVTPLVQDFLNMYTDRFGMLIVLSNSRVGHTRRSLNDALMGQQVV